jgi:Tol biopolymer transport system component
VFAGLGGLANYDVAPGVLAFLKQGDARNQLMLLDFSGKQIETLDKSAAISAERISPDRTKVMVSKFNMQFHSADLWTYDLNQHNWERLTFDSAPGEHYGVWSPDGQQIIYSTFLNGHENLYRKTRSGDAAALVENNFDKEPCDWSLDGRFLLFAQNDTNGSGDLWIYPLAGDGKPYPILESRFNERHGRFSPDGRWIAYQSDESGQGEVYVRPFPGSGNRIQISSGGGRQARWSRDGRTLYYVTLDSKLMEIPITSNGSSLRPGTSRLLFPVPKDSEYELISDKRILLNQVIGNTSSLPNIILNWETELNNKKK